MEQSGKKTIIALAVLVVIGALMWFVSQMSPASSSSTSTTQLNTQKPVTVAPPPILKLAPSELAYKKAEILKRVNDKAHPLTEAEKQSMVKYISGATGDQFGFTMQEKVAIVNAINHK